MFKRLYRWILSVLLIFAAIMVAISNPQSVVLSIDPFAPEGSGVLIPLYLLILLSILIGVIIGGFAGWRGGGKARKYARAYKKAEKRSSRDKSKDVVPVDGS